MGECKNSIVFELQPRDENRSSVKDELDAIGYELTRILDSVDQIERFNNLCNDYEVQSIRRRIDTIAQRAYRAEQCSRGIKVWKAN